MKNCQHLAIILSFCQFGTFSPNPVKLNLTELLPTFKELYFRRIELIEMTNSVK